MPSRKKSPLSVTVGSLVLKNPLLIRIIDSLPPAQNPSFTEEPLPREVSHGNTFESSAIDGQGW